MPVASLPSSPAPTSPTPILSLNTSLLYRLRVTMWLRWQLLGASWSLHPWRNTLLALFIFIQTLSFSPIFFLTLATPVSRTEYSALISGLCWFTFLAITWGAMVLDKANAKELQTSDTDLILSLPLGRIQSYAIVLFDSCATALPLVAYCFLALLWLLSGALGFVLALVIWAVYAIGIAAWFTLLRCLNKHLRDSTNTVLGCLVTLIYLSAAFFGISLIHFSENTSSNHDAAGLAAILPSSPASVAAVLHYSLPGSAAELCSIANGYSSQPPLLWTLVFFANLLVLASFGCYALALVGKTYQPLKGSAERLADKGKVRLRQSAPKLRISLDYLWVYLVRNPRLRELMQVRALAAPSSLLWVLIVAAAVFLFRLGTHPLPASAVWAMEFVWITLVATVFMPPALVISSGMLSMRVLQTSVPRMLLIKHVFYLLMPRYLLAVIAASCLTLPWDSGCIPAILIAALLAWGVFMMNMANTLLLHAILQFGVSEGWWEYPSQPTSDVNWLIGSTIFFILLQLPVLPLIILLTRTVNWNLDKFVAPSYAASAVCIAYAFVYVLVVMRLSAKSLEKHDFTY